MRKPSVDARHRLLASRLIRGRFGGELDGLDQAGVGVRLHPSNIVQSGLCVNSPREDCRQPGGPELGLPGPAAILSTDPVTATDLRKLALDVEGVGNAWVEQRNDPELVFHYHPGSGELRLQPAQANRSWIGFDGPKPEPRI